LAILESAIQSPQTAKRDWDDPASYRVMYLIRATERRLEKLFRDGLVFGTLHSCEGQEACAVGVASALRPTDVLVGGHRSHGHYIAHTDDVEGLIAEVMGREAGCVAGRGGSQHLYRDHRFYSNGVQGSMIAPAAGIALAQKLGKTGNIAAAFIGDGTLGQGVLYETLNLASLYQIPVLFVLENNLYAMSTRMEDAVAGSITGRAEAFGIRSMRVDASSARAVFEAAQSCVSFVRDERTSAFLVLDTYRFSGHSKSDDRSYRTRDEEELWHNRDPLQALRAELPIGLVEEIEAECDDRVEAAVRAAETSPYPVLEVGEAPRATHPRPKTDSHAKETCIQAVRRALSEALRDDARVLLLGEDIRDPYGGAFKVTKGMTAEFPDRILNTPISEASIVGLSVGLALGGYRPVAEIMFGDFVTLAMDQFATNVSKLPWMYNAQVTLSLVVRLPMGGRRGYGATHSQSLEKLLVGLPFVDVVAASIAHDVATVLKTAIHSDKPVAFVEYKLDYGRELITEWPHGELGWTQTTSEELYPVVSLSCCGFEDDVALVTYGGNLGLALEAAEEALIRHEVAVRVVAPSLLNPSDWSSIVAAIGDRPVVVLEEGTKTLGWGAEVVARLAESRNSPRPVRRVAALDLPIPNSRPLEDSMLPGREQVVAAMLEVRRGG
jgi:2-oxoisovalerate dehydrogenase E1 component